MSDTDTTDVREEAVRVIARMRHLAYCSSCEERVSPDDTAAAVQTVDKLVALGWTPPVVAAPGHGEHT